MPDALSMARMYCTISSAVTLRADTMLSMWCSSDTSSTSERRLIFAIILHAPRLCRAALIDMSILASSTPVIATKASVSKSPSSRNSSLSVPSPTMTRAFGRRSLISTHRASLWSIILTLMPMRNSSSAR